jgi:choline-sulfatase
MKEIVFNEMRAFLLASLIIILPTSVRAADRPPNILFLFADDLTYASIRELGNTEIQTPNLDRLVRSGTTFTHCYNQGGFHGAICVASRAMLMTGRSLWHVKALDQQFQKGKRDRPLWPELMKSAGYDTYHTGKWHVAVDSTEVFDTSIHVRGGMPGTVEASYNRPLDGLPDPWKPWDESVGGYWEGGRHWSAVVADDAEQFLASAQKSDHPFFMYVAFNAPHDPRQSPKEFVDRYPVDKIQLPVSFLPEYPWKDQIGCVPETRDERLMPYPRTEQAVKVHRSEYYAIITHLDEQIGRVLDTLERNGQAENTYVFFSADHGLAVGQHGLVGKQNLFDHSVRVPFIAQGPKFEKNKRIDAGIYLQDIVPTTLELAGAKVPADCEFRSLLPLASGERETQYHAIYGAYMDLQRSVTQDGFKLLLYPRVPKSLLFNLKEDPDELHDLSEAPAQADLKRRLFQKLRELQQERDDSLNLTTTFPQLAVVVEE